MIEAARALRDQAWAEIGLHEQQIAQLRALVTGLDAFIDQPPADPSPTGQSGASTPVSGPVVPPAVKKPKPAGPSRDDASRRSADEGATAGGSASPAASSHVCPEPGCDRTFDTLQQMGSHRFQAHIRRWAENGAPDLTGHTRSGGLGQ